MSVYILKSESSSEDYVRLEGDFSRYRMACMKSELQYLDTSAVTFTVSEEEGGLQFPDLICQDGLTFISEGFREALDDCGVKNVFLKRADIVSKIFGIHETYWILVPPRLDCIDLDRSRLHLEWDWEDGLMPAILLREGDQLVLDEGLFGSFQMFKIFGLADNNIYITQKLYNRLQPLNLRGVGYIKF